MSRCILKEWNSYFHLPFKKIHLSRTISARMYKRLRASEFFYIYFYKKKDSFGVDSWKKMAKRVLVG